MKYFCSSDIHSFFDEWMSALELKGFDKNNPDHAVIVCGDLFDRGPKSKETFEFAKMLQAQNRLIYVAGNHESLLFDCLIDIYRGRMPGSHHFSNGTIKTICQFCEEDQWIMYDPTWNDKICKTMQPVIDFIQDNCIDYAEVGNNIFVHGWIPCHQGLDDFRDGTSEDWERARWENGMEMWKNPRCRVDGKTVVCGHWHCSWGWSYIRHERKEFPQKNRSDWQKSFEPFIDEGIIAVDSCTAYSGIVNVVVFDDGGNLI